MKKILFLSLVAVAAACCGPKNEVSVDKLIAGTAEYVGKDVTFVGKAVVTNLEAKRVAVFGSDSTKYIIVQADDSAKFCGSLCHKIVKVVGTVVALDDEVVIADEVGDAVYAVDKFYVVAKCIGKAECCKKDGEKACKKDEEKKECPADKE